MPARSKLSERFDVVEATVANLAAKLGVGPPVTGVVLDAHGRPVTAVPPPPPAPNPAAGSSYFPHFPGYPPPYYYPPPAAAAPAGGMTDGMSAVLAVIAEKAFERPPDPSSSLLERMLTTFMELQGDMMAIAAENKGPDLEGIAALLHAAGGPAGINTVLRGAAPQAPPGAPAPGTAEDIQALIQHVQANPAALQNLIRMAQGQSAGSPFSGVETEPNGEDGPQ
jgi:hypothetical protein